MPTNTVRRLFPKQVVPATELARVCEAAGGEARSVERSDGIAARVAGHLSQVPAVSENDWVLVTYVGEEAVVCGRLRQPEEPLPAVLTQQDGVVELEAGARLRLAAGKSLIELHADGRISIDGREVYTFGERRVVVQGSAIELN